MKQSNYTDVYNEKECRNYRCLGELIFLFSKPTIDNEIVEWYSCNYCKEIFMKNRNSHLWSDCNGILDNNRYVFHTRGHGDEGISECVRSSNEN